MTLNVSNKCSSTVECDTLVVLMTNSEHQAENIRQLDQATGNLFAAIRDRKDFAADACECLCLFQVPGIAAQNVVLVGLGTKEKCDLRTLRKAMLSGLRLCCSEQGQSVAILPDDNTLLNFSTDTIAQTAADAVVSAPLDADLYKAERSRHPFANATLCLSRQPESSAAVNEGRVIGECCGIVKTLVNRTANDLTPAVFADEAMEHAGNLGIDVEVFDEERLREERMGALLAVARGSELAPRMVRLRWEGGQTGPELAIVGKGVTFDSGGYSIKPSDSMISMKADMAGAATAYASIIAAAQLNLPIRLTVYLGLVENMISGNAYRLGDVITARNGLTIEIHNTDAEGRLVMADVLSYAVDHGADKLIDMATLTGACVVALGEEITGLFAGDDSLKEELIRASESAGEYFWPMPMHEHFHPLLKSKVADCKNVGPRWGGAVTAARFLQQFTDGASWAHLDIAGPSWADSATSWQDAGGTADPLRSIVSWLKNYGSQVSGKENSPVQ